MPTIVGILTFISRINYQILRYEPEFSTNYTPGIYADGYIVFAFPFVRSSVRMFVSSLVRWFVSSVKMSKFWLKFLCWCISHELYIRNHSYLDYRYPIGLALFL